MGKTNTTNRDYVDEFFDDWQRYRRALRAPNQGHWDSLKAQLETKDGE